MVVSSPTELWILEVKTLIDKDLTKDELCSDDGITLVPKEIFAWLSRVLYNRRRK